VRDRQRNRRAGTTRPRDAKDAKGAAGKPEAKVRAASPSTLRHRLRTIDRELQPLLTQRAELETRMGDGDHRELQTAAETYADVVQRIHHLEEQWLEVAADLEAIE
jgi:hypothetical protein